MSLCPEGGGERFTNQLNQVMICSCIPNLIRIVQCYNNVIYRVCLSSVECNGSHWASEAYTCTTATVFKNLDE